MSQNNVDGREWQPIETAPKDGAWVILAPHLMVAWWDEGDQEWMLLQIPLNEDRTIANDWSQKPAMWFCLYASIVGTEPTHWMPLPEPPATLASTKAI